YNCASLHTVPYNSICSRCGAFFLVNLLLPVVKFPPVEYPSPETVTNWLLTYIPFTVILFSVIVPVLSVQMIDAQPKVSTAFNLRTTARRFIILCTPRDKATVTIAGNPSGITATASETPARNISYIGSP